MLAYQREYLKPCPTLSESGASNKIVNATKTLKAKRSKYFIQRMLATIEEKMRSLVPMLMYGKEASNRKQEIDRQHYTIPNQRPKDKHCGKI